MLIASYNRKVLGDILVVVVDQDGEEQVTEVKNNVAIIKDVENDRVLGFNFLNVSQILGEIEVNGQVFLTPEQVEKLNQVLRDNEITAELEFDDSPKFVVGHVESLEEHPNSDHLHITKTRVDNNQEVLMRENYRLQTRLEYEAFANTGFANEHSLHSFCSSRCSTGCEQSQTSIERQEVGAAASSLL